MNTDVKTVTLPESNQTKADRQEKVPALRLQTGVRAGGFYDAWFSATENFNQADRTAGHV